MAVLQPDDHLQVRISRLALAHKWLSKTGFAEGTDPFISNDDEAWLAHLHSVTDHLLAALPSISSGRILELGCGTGYATASLVNQYPNLPIAAVEVSEYLLIKARRQGSNQNIEYTTADMFAYLMDQPSRSASLIFSAWSIGYSKPNLLRREAARVLLPGGIFAFVINLADMIRPIVRALRECKARFPDKVALAYVPNFPKSWPVLEKRLNRSGLSVDWHDERQTIVKTSDQEIKTTHLPQLIQTGKLSSAVQSIVIKEYTELAEYFDRELAKNNDVLTHHYVAVVAHRA